ncbi:MAG: hypothetical protein IPI88_10520 [Chitinophagaceae bacterium]|nr:hypothetical protein [Chitinophagaceae bacterium]
MSNNLYIVRHGKMLIEDRNKPDYLHLSKEGLDFGLYLDNYFKDIYFGHILYMSIDVKTSDPYNRCRSTIRGTKGIKSEFDKTQLSKMFDDINKLDNGRQNVLLCYRTEAFNVISNILDVDDNDELFNKDYNRIFHFSFNNNNYSFVKKVNTEEK